MPRKNLNGQYNSNALLSPPRYNCWLLIKLMGLLIFMNVTVSCPLNCYCQSNTGLVQCHFPSPQEVLVDIPYWVQNLSLTGSNITFLQASIFRSNGTNLSNLSTLILTNNNIEAIDPDAFLQMPSLTTLDLSFNCLHSIPNATFMGLSQLQVLKLNCALGEPAQRELLLNSQWAESLRSLRTLEITGNELPSFPSTVLNIESLQTIHIGNNSIERVDVETISALKVKKVHVYLSPNPIVCDCDIRAMLLWLRNTSQTLDAHILQCSTPPNLNGTLVAHLQSDNLKCINEDLETASYVFFGIVLALIGVIFLMVLYLNRRGIKRWLNNFREACRDQMEGYHYRYEQDSDPRRSNASTGI
ncbi:trophoblast glycoprotein-like [Pseudophryne corroboree]|uniref:trophoblast glycoprotein-like n=1 Tax=Pseudophryne corroboree TaxID=495146 RepID=UPI00308127AC